MVIIMIAFKSIASIERGMHEMCSVIKFKLSYMEIKIITIEKLRAQYVNSIYVLPLNQYLH